MTGNFGDAALGFVTASVENADCVADFEAQDVEGVMGFFTGEEECWQVGQKESVHGRGE